MALVYSYSHACSFSCSVSFPFAYSLIEDSWSVPSLRHQPLTVLQPCHLLSVRVPFLFVWRVSIVLQPLNLKWTAKLQAGVHVLSLSFSFHLASLQKWIEKYWLQLLYAGFHWVTVEKQPMNIKFRKFLWIELLPWILLNTMILTLLEAGYIWTVDTMVFCFIEQTSRILRHMTVRHLMKFQMVVRSQSTQEVLHVQTHVLDHNGWC